LRVLRLRYVVATPNVNPVAAPLRMTRHRMLRSDDETL
jgi:hypothetical protein